MSTQVELTRPRRNLILAVCCTSVFLGNLNNTVLNVALPAMQRDLRSPLSGLQWTTDAYLIVLAALLMLADLRPLDGEVQHHRTGQEPADGEV
ncbi:MFS transporter, partial [Streptomyces noursei]